MWLAAACCCCCSSLPIFVAQLFSLTQHGPVHLCLPVFVDRRSLRCCHVVPTPRFAQSFRLPSGRRQVSRRANSLARLLCIRRPAWLCLCETDRHSRQTQTRACGGGRAGGYARTDADAEHMPLTLVSGSLLPTLLRPQRALNTHAPHPLCRNLNTLSQYSCSSPLCRDPNTLSQH